MTTPRQLARHVLKELDSRREGAVAARPELLEPLAAAIQEALAAWPKVAVDLEVFGRYLAARIPDLPDPGVVLRGLQVADLYLCCGCALGDPASLAIFMERYAPVLRLALQALRLGPGLSEEVAQQLVVHLLVAPPGEPPVIAQYAGVAKLESWLRVVASRAGRRALGREKRVVLSDDQRLSEELLDFHPDVDRLYAKSIYRETFQCALREAMSSLTPRETTLLRQRFVDRLGLEQIGAIYRVHHTTIRRWLDKAHHRLLQRTQAGLAARLKIPRAECDSIIRLIQSDIDLTLHTLLGISRADAGERPHAAPVADRRSRGR